MIECVKPRNLTEAIMRRILAILILSSILLSMTGCSKKSPRLDVENFEKYVLSDMGLERKAGATLDAPGYYNMDDTIDNSDASSMKRDHYAQVYSKSEKMPIGSIKITAQKKIRRVTTTVSKPRALIFTMQRE